MGAGTIIVSVIAIAVVTALLAVLRVKTDTLSARGCDPGQGDQLIDIAYCSGGLGGGHGSVMRVTRDPQQYARAFVPDHASGKRRQTGK
ncbi:hypothetical protein KPG71_00250 [Roseovarius sp. PS-C2]|uniref:hypothetical protein n=1 Tax=Roseovarius sp. PS-C2 TaxID=2820814 RepID=UPI001C0BD0AB|nr:hypothetical protein [Roseovarius sp. PS-C2]MBU3258433.1 hypothetical protein [Roseovarius sp. PS-C2]